MASSEKSGKSPQPFDVSTVERLIGLMTQHDLSEVDLHAGDSRIRLRRGHAPVVVSHAPAAPLATTATPPAPSAVPPVDDGKKYHTITSPTPGTFYAQASPGNPPYVKAGSKVSMDTVVCKIEAMKIFNDITADCAGTIFEVLVKDAQPVEYGQPLFRVQV